MKKDCGVWIWVGFLFFIPVFIIGLACIFTTPKKDTLEKECKLIEYVPSSSIPTGGGDVIFTPAHGCYRCEDGKEYCVPLGELE